MTLEEAINHCEEKACGNTECSNEHKQLAEWLKELQQMKSRPSNLDDAAQKHVRGYHPAIQKMCMEEFVARAEWAQQMKEVCGFQNETYTGSVDTISHIPGPRKLADSDEDEQTLSSLDDAAEEYAVGLNLSGYVRVINAFKAGAEWMARREKLLKED